jgi:23S rRNA (adenine1618-N6)-methyltransferase
MAMEHGKQRKRKRAREMHPANRYAEAAPDFGYLASLYPSFAPFVTFTGKAHHAKIDWTDFNATRELTRTILFHDFGIQW